jgi:hypothetical protein
MGRVDQRRAGVRSVTLGVGIALAFAAGACAGDSNDPSSGPSSEPPSDTPVIVTFEVAGDERFKALLTEPDDIEIAWRLFAGEDAPGIPNGLVVPETGVNDGWTWSLDPDDLEFAAVTMEVCDGIPSDVEAGLVTSDRYCPWSAIVVEIVRAP